MSRYTSYTCDICGKEIVRYSAHAAYQELATIKLWAPGVYRYGGGERFDLCMDCYNRFVSFLESGGRGGDLE